MKNRRWTAALLLAALAAGTLVSCGSAADTPAAVDTGAKPAETEAETEAPKDPAYVADIDHTKNWDGRDFRILAAAYWSPGDEFTIDEITGDAVDDAVFNRNKKVEDLYGVNISADVMDNAKATVQKEVQSGSQTYDVFALCAYESAALAVNNFYVDLMSTENINLNKKYWDQALVRNMSIDNKLFYAAGDISMRANDGTFLMLFNKNLAAQNDLPDLFQTVRDGKWTMSYFNTLIQDVTRDLDGDGKLTPEDMWGFATQQEAYLGFYYACDETIIGRDKDGMPMLDLASDRFYRVYETIVDVLRKGDKTLSAHDYLGYGGSNDLINSKIFKESRALFYYSVAGCFSGFRDMKDDYGVLPAPKFDEAQADYVSYVYHGAGLFSIPTTAADTAFSGFVMEALAEEGYASVTPIYYETTMKDKYQRDENSSEMLDIIFRNRVWDLGYIVDFGQLSTKLMQQIAKGAENFSSTYEKSIKSTQKAITKYIETYEESTKY